MHYLWCKVLTGISLQDHQLKQFSLERVRTKRITVNCFFFNTYVCICFPCGSAGKESSYSAGHLGSISRGRSPGDQNGYPYHYFCLENSIARGAWRAYIAFFICKALYEYCIFYFLFSQVLLVYLILSVHLLWVSTFGQDVENRGSKEWDFSKDLTVALNSF